MLLAVGTHEIIHIRIAMKNFYIGFNHIDV